MEDEPVLYLSPVSNETEDRVGVYPFEARVSPRAWLICSEGKSEVVDTSYFLFRDSTIDTKKDSFSIGEVELDEDVQVLLPEVIVPVDIYLLEMDVEDVFAKGSEKPPPFMPVRHELVTTSGRVFCRTRVLSSDFYLVLQVLV